MFDEAVAAYDKALMEHSDHTYSIAKRDLLKIKKEYEDKNFINPELAEEHKEKGNDLMKEGKFPEAIEEYSTAI